MATQPTGPRLVPADELYTTLLMVATGLLFVGIVFIIVRSVQLFGSVFPAPGGG